MQKFDDFVKNNKNGVVFMYLLPKIKGNEIIMYLRKSRADDPLATVEEVLEKHEQMLDEWMSFNLPEGGVVPEENRLREVVSGETISSRPRMGELLRRIESPSIKAVLVKEPSRLSRGDLQEIGYLVKVLMYSGTLVLTTQGSYDLRDERDREQFERELMRGNDYLKYQKKILRAGKLLALKNGCYIGSHPPYGYKKVSYKEGRNTCHTLEPIPEEAEVVRRVYDLYLSGEGAVRICDILDEERVTPPRGKKWATGTIVSMLSNIHYIGKVRWDYRRLTHHVEDGEIKQRRTQAEDFLVFDGKHPAIIDQDTWDRAQAKRGSIPRYKKKTGLKNPLSGILYCTCGKAMNYKQTTYQGRNVGDPRFNCGDVRCRANGSAKLKEIMQDVTQVLRECVDDFEVQIDAGVDNSAELHKQTVARLEKKLEDLRDLEAKQWDEKLKGGMPEHVFERLNSQTLADIEYVTQALCEAKNAAPVHVDLHEKLVTFQTALALLEDPDASVKEQNVLLRKCIERIVYSRPRLDGYVGKKGNPEPFSLRFTLRV